MADAPSAQDALRRTDATPIAQLRPDLEDGSSRVVQGVVTITWPYSVVTKSVAFVLAEPDFRLRRDKGQLRVELHGPAAQALANSSFGAGDEARISLRGAEWEKPRAMTPLPAGTLEWQLKFSDCLLLEVRRAQDESKTLIQVDGPQPQEPQPGPSSPNPDRQTPSPPDAQSQLDHAPGAITTPSASLPAKRPASSMLGADEYASPAFLKRARVSYGSLFEDGLDIFDQAHDAKVKNKRRSRFSMPSTAWRYTSRSTSPESDKQSNHEANAEVTPAQLQEAPGPAGSPKTSPPRPSMVDEACQTHEVYFSPSQVDASTLAASHASGPMLQHASASGQPAQHQDHVGFETPSRTLFDRRHSQRDMLSTAHVPDMAFGIANSQSHDFGFDQRVGPATLPAAQPVETEETDAALTSGYHLEPFNGNHIDATAMNIDPSLQFPDPMPVPNHMYFGAPPAGHVGWPAEPLEPANPWNPMQENAQLQAAAVADPSPSRSQPQSISSGSSDSGRSESGSSASESGFQTGPAGEASDADAVEFDADPRYDDARDIPGEDYDLRNYDRARDDDEEESEEETEPDGSDIEQQAVDLSEDEEDGELQEDAPASEDYDEAEIGAQGIHRDSRPGEDAGYLSYGKDGTDEAEDVDGLETDDQGSECYDEENEDFDEHYEEEDEDGDEESDEYDEPINAAPRAPASQGPVFIDLLSDSEDEPEPQTGPRPSSHPPPPMGNYVPFNGNAERAPEAASAPEAQQADKPSVQSSTDPYHKDNFSENPAQEVAGEAQRQDLAMEPVFSEPARAAVPGDGARTHGVDGEDAGEGEPDPEVQRSPEGEERRIDSDIGNKEQAASPPAVAVPSEPMDVDEELFDEAPGEKEPRNETPSKATCAADGDLHTGTEAPEELAQEQPASGEAMELSTAHPETVVDAAGLEPLQPQGTPDGPQVPIEAPVPPVHYIADDFREHHALSPQTPGAEMGTTVIEVEEVEERHSEVFIPDLSPEASEDLAEPEAPDAAPSAAEVAPLPTPAQNQHKEDTAMLAVSPEESPQEDDDLAAQAQIMAEYQAYHTPAKQLPSSGEDRKQVESGSKEPELLITVKSLRSRGHRRNGSGDTSTEDPSIMLAKASASQAATAEPGTQPKPPTRLLAAGQRGDTMDPSMSLAKASASEQAQAEDGQSLTTSRGASGMADDEAGAMPAAGASSSSPRSKRRHATPEVTRELRSKSHDVARRSTPETTVEAILQSPSVAGSVEDETVAAMKRNLQKTLRTALPDFLPLRSLRSSLNKTIDVLAVSTWTPPQPHRPKHGPRDYMLELILTDPSAAPTSVVVAHLFRPHQASLPTVKAGDVILLRRVQVVSVKGRGFGARAGEASAWAVFEKDDDEMLPQIKGPPVEVTEAEVEYAQGLKRWWGTQSEGAMAKVDKATQKALQGGKGDAR